MNKTTLIIVIVIFISILVFLSIVVLHIKRRRQKRDESYKHHDPLKSMPSIKSRSRQSCPDMYIESEARSSGHASMSKEKERLRREQETRMLEEQRIQEAEAKRMVKREAFREKYRISIAHPKLLSKRYTSRFLIHIYLPEMRRWVSRKLKKQFEEQKIEEHIQDSELEIGQEVKLKLFSPGIVFSEPVPKKLDKSIISTNFIAQPADNCHPGNHQVILSISDVKT